MKIKITVFLLAQIIFAGSVKAQSFDDQALIHRKNSIAFRLLNDIYNTLPADSILIHKEYKRVFKSYKEMSDSLRGLSDSALYANFEVQRTIGQCYGSQNLKELHIYYDSLLLLSYNYFKYIEKNAVLSNDIAKCFVNSLEGKCTNEDTILSIVEEKIYRHFSIVYDTSTDTLQMQNLVNRYAAQYYGRGIISMAEPLFRKFKTYYQTLTPRTQSLEFSKNYTVYDKYKKKRGTLADRVVDKIFVFNQVKNNFDIVYLISLIRLTDKIYPDREIIVARDISLLTDRLIEGIGNNLSCNFLYINLDSTDIENFHNQADFVLTDNNNTLVYTTSNAIEMMEMLEAPVAEKTAKQKLERNKRMQELKRKRELAKNQPPDTSLKYQTQIGETTLQLKGNWPEISNVDISTWYFTNENKKKSFDKYGLNQLNIYENENIINRQLILYSGINQNINDICLLANNKYEIQQFIHADTVNSSYNQYLKQLNQYLMQIQHYNRVVDEYPFPESDFIEKMKYKLQKTHNLAEKMIADINISIEVQALINAHFMLNNLKTHKPKKQVEYDDFHRLLSTNYFDTIIYYSPLYKQLIDAWIMFGYNDLKNTIDLLFSSQHWIPEKSVSQVGNYIWKKLNAAGREDLMLYMDTLYLVGCSNSNIDVKKRLEGYKRMATGNIAPNINWIDNGIEKQLYNINADTTYVVFWADWCDHCKKTLPALYEKLSNKYNITVVAVNIDQDSSSTDLGNKLLPNWHHVQASDYWNDEIVELYNVFGTPSIYLLDKEFRILDKLSQ